MLSEDRLRVMAFDVRARRKKLGLEPEKLAGKTGVGARFIRNFEQERAFQNQKRYFFQLLNVLIFLKLQQHEDELREVIAGTVIFRRKQRFKFDCRRGGVVPRRH